jgi:hypothetical protein
MAETKPARKLLQNSGRSGVVYDEAGHSLGGGEHIELPAKLDVVGKAAVDAGYLRVITVN